MDGAIVAAAQLPTDTSLTVFCLTRRLILSMKHPRAYVEVDSKPEEIDELDRRIIQLKIEREALKKENDAASKDRLGQTGNRTHQDLEANRQP